MATKLINLFGARGIRPGESNMIAKSLTFKYNHEDASMTTATLKTPENRGYYRG